MLASVKCKTLTGAALLTSYLAAAQSSDAAAAPTAAKGMDMQTMLFWFLVGLLAFVLLLYVLVGVLIIVQMRPQLRKVYEMPTVQASWSGKVLGLFVGDPVLLKGRVADVVIADHDYDGIHEFDNDLPPWWKYGFYVTILFAGAYLFYFHVSKTGELSHAEYETEMKQAALLVSAGSDDPNKLTDFQALTAAADISGGKSIFTQNCAPCHGANAEGKVGPNLTDEYWLHGGEVNHVYKTVKFGVQGKGMVAWKGKLSSKQILQVSSYILSLQGSKPANAKEPQGEKDPSATKIAMR
ncbi:cbb3-type cytochrome c oxidase N-terminal domain-containing protein [Hymenobacter sp. GOD-10R]|uniref:cbb3-type cytochrome c oxidase N-terminal domain-containing protein n=1 Tax=Hymenobacter sp. GOD-10R TaxID=3093922 RepID=UPI002D78F358|nr:cbb3-type cytochrome c oxidase N-terminal domain-containing protein [Hymenobacter sp. GOD-10R]WRQ27742.1 cbb3-type cytochrome c oxidase N-terminal domain-containing protein [Hymenobacter sp. GOD-10R]